MWDVGGCDVCEGWEVVMCVKGGVGGVVCDVGGCDVCKGWEGGGVLEGNS